MRDKINNVELLSEEVCRNCKCNTVKDCPLIGTSLFPKSNYCEAFEVRILIENYTRFDDKLVEAKEKGKK